MAWPLYYSFFSFFPTLPFLQLNTYLVGVDIEHFLLARLIKGLVKQVHDGHQGLLETMNI